MCIGREEEELVSEQSILLQESEYGFEEVHNHAKRKKTKERQPNGDGFRSPIRWTKREETMEETN